MAGLATSLGFAGTAGLCCLGTDNPRGLSSLKSTPWTSTPAAMNGYQPYISRRISQTQIHDIIRLFTNIFIEE